jgi:hypothetical protein
MMHFRYWCIFLALAVAGCGAGGSGGLTTTDAQTNPSQSPDISLSASKQRVEPGERVLLQWSAVRAESCNASGDWGGVRAISGEYQTPPINGNQTYTLSCNGPGGGAVARVSVTTSGADEGAPDVQIKAVPRGVSYNGVTTVTWETSNVTSCTASGDWSGTKALSGSERLNSITSDRTYRLSCTGTDGNAVGMAAVTLREARLSWQRPRRNVDGSRLDKLAGYKIYRGTSPGKYTDTVRIDNPNTTSHKMELKPGTHYFAMTAVTSDGEESDYSNEIAKEVY